MRTLFQQSDLTCIVLVVCFRDIMEFVGIYCFMCILVSSKYMTI